VVAAESEGRTMSGVLVRGPSSRRARRRLALPSSPTC
jgi:hypothetical protein